MSKVLKDDLSDIKTQEIYTSDQKKKNLTEQIALFETNNYPEDGIQPVDKAHLPNNPLSSTQIGKTVKTSDSSKQSTVDQKKDLLKNTTFTRERIEPTISKEKDHLKNVNSSEKNVSTIPGGKKHLGYVNDSQHNVRLNNHGPNTITAKDNKRFETNYKTSKDTTNSGTIQNINSVHTSETSNLEQNESDIPLHCIDDLKVCSFDQNSSFKSSTQIDVPQQSDKLMTEISNVSPDNNYPNSNENKLSSGFKMKLHNFFNQLMSCFNKFINLFRKKKKEPNNEPKEKKMKVLDKAENKESVITMVDGNITK